jgi:hypothetical protein
MDPSLSLSYTLPGPFSAHGGARQHTYDLDW